MSIDKFSELKISREEMAGLSGCKIEKPEEKDTEEIKEEEKKPKKEKNGAAS